MPEFWLGQLLILLFAVWLGWLPAQGSAVAAWAVAPGLVEHLRYLILPASALSLRYLALISRITRAALIEILGADHILAARARGIGSAGCCSSTRSETRRRR